ncbi:sugar-binding protein [Litchfieldia salsa]|uniref:Monosaccharide ABC transporter substrate-binding protein, CUT2 family n=1 Tax=Litchfieldia salsa TaxID=930152 RepID=A0A1H0Q2B8_9BACI|nr:sugar-binding protein [Litchfieldia salsa]SDP10769.1 monosaccharide ABC transporter substrate-binding protein, CUT2 family [Litchfieldia salsa]
MRHLSKLIFLTGIILFLFTFSIAVYFSQRMNNYGETSVNSKIPNYKYHFVLVPEEVDNDYWRLVEKGAQEAARKNHVLLEYVGPKQGNIDEHLKTLEKAAASNVDGIITQSLNEEEFPPLIDSLIDQGIPVVTIDTDSENSKRISYIGTNNYYSGFIAGTKLIEDTKGEVNVAIITGNFHSSNQSLRVDGFKEAVKHEERIKIVAIEESKISQIRAAEKAYQILNEYPQVNAFFGTSALDGIGIAQIVQQLNRDYIYIIGFDTLKETIEYIKDGVINATVSQQPFEMGYQSVELMVQLLEGKKVPEINYTDTLIIQKEDLSSDKQIGGNIND